MSRFSMTLAPPQPSPSATSRASESFLPPLARGGRGGEVARLSALLSNPRSSESSNSRMVASAPLTRPPLPPLAKGGSAFRLRSCP
jgi:hypothetical protein